MKKKILVFLDHAIVIRHFVSSGAFSEIEKIHEVLYAVPPADHKRIAGADLSAIPASRLVRIPESTPRSMVWTRLFQIETLRNRAEGHARALAEHHRRSIGPKAFWLYSLLGLPLVWPIYRRILKARLSTQRNLALEAFIDRERPDVVLHPTVLAGTYINDLIEACRARAIPVVGIMNSWDNPSTKRAVVGHFDWLLVWGQQTKDHAIRYMRMDPDRVVRFGAAQLDLYRDEPQTARAKTRAFYGLGDNTRMLLYAGSSKGSDEYQHLDFLETAIENGELPNVAVVYRPHPWGNCGKDGGRIASRNWKHVHFEASMEAYIQAAKLGPQPVTTPDYRHTQDILAATDILVSPVSTILLEASLNGIPNICLIDDIDDKNWYMEVNTRLEHLREYFDTPEFLVARNIASLVPRIADALALLDDAQASLRIKNAARYFVDTFSDAYSARLCSFVEDLFAPTKRRLGIDYLIVEPEGEAAEAANRKVSVSEANS